MIKTSAPLFENKTRRLYGLEATGKALTCQCEIVIKIKQNMVIAIRKQHRDQPLRLRGRLD